MAVFAFDRVVDWLAWGHPHLASPAVFALAAVCTAFAFVRYPVGGRCLRILLAGLSVYMALYALALGTDLSIAGGEDAALFAQGVAWTPALLVATGALSLLRPSFAAFPMLYVAFHKEATRAMGGAVELASNDYLPLVEVGLFLACAVVMIGLIRRIAAARTMPVTAGANAIALVFAVAIGAHLGNYVMSGFAKVMLDGGPLSWMLENPTSSLMLSGYELGAAPLSGFPSLFTTLYDAFRAIEVPSNVVVLAIQLGCVVAFLHRRLLIAVTVFFDVMHISIFMLTGALFIPWIVLNSLIVASAATLQRDRLPAPAIALGIATALFGHVVFYNATLGWYDSREIRVGYFEAIDDDGTVARVPPSFFRESSYLLYARHFGFREWRQESGHVPTSAWGQIGLRVAPGEGDGRSNAEVMRLGKSCAYPVSADAPPDFDETRPAPFIIGQHTRSLAAASGDRWSSYDLYPHHHFSMPWRFEPFDAMSPHAIAAYRYVVETVCLGVEDGHVTRTVMARTATDPIPVKTSPPR